ncbi:MAG: response regulator [Bacteroidia bacterium]|nr:response regulator [Bacteroidia bacterium]
MLSFIKDKINLSLAIISGLILILIGISVFQLIQVNLQSKNIITELSKSQSDESSSIIELLDNVGFGFGFITAIAASLIVLIVIILLVSFVLFKKFLADLNDTKAELAYTKDIIDSANVSLIVINSDLVISDVIQATNRILGYDHNELIGKSFKLIINNEEFLKDLLLYLNKKGRVQNVERNYKTKDGQRKLFSISASLFKSKFDNEENIIFIAQDISIFKQADKKLIKAKQIAQSNAKMKEQFLANMSHELRTPLNAVIGLSDLLLKAETSKKQAKYITAINYSAESLLNIVNDVLDFSKLQAGKMLLNDTDFNLKKKLLSIQKSNKFKAEEKDLKLKYSCDNKIPNVIVGDDIKLTQVFINLIGNAIKFTEEGEIFFGATLKEKDFRNASIDFYVSDTGIGIPEKKLKGIFDSFIQVEGEKTRNAGGTGLGLSISKQFIDLMGGDLEVTSKVGKGTQFSFNIKFPISKKSLMEIIMEESKERDFSTIPKVDILLVEDNEYNRLVANDMIELWEFVNLVDTAENGLIALEKIKSNSYDLVLMDIQMPEMDGLTATREIRKMDKPLCDIPIIGLTAHAFKQELDKCKDAGMEAVVTKPIDSTILQNTIIHFLEKGEGGDIKKLDELSEDEVMPESNEPNEPESQNTIENSTENPSQEGRLVDFSFMKNLYKGKNDKLKEMIKLFLKDTPGQIATMKELCEQKNWDGVRKIAHPMKPKVTYIGILSMKDVIANIEQYSKKQENLDEIPELLDKFQSVCNEAYKELREEIEILGD